MQQKIIILDFGSQTTQLIGRRVRELDTFCEILPYNKFPKDDPSVIGVILSGSPYSVHDPEAFKVDLSQFMGRIPVLGICYGAQFISHALGGKVEKADSREYGRANLETINLYNPLFKGFDRGSQVWMSHGDTITAIPEGFEVIGSTHDVKYAAFATSTAPSKGGECLRAEDTGRPSSPSGRSGGVWLAQGTIYPDRIESLNITGKVIKSHHNVGGLPKEMNLKLCEPLKWLFKDEVRRVGRQLGMPEHLITRHPFPGPGLAVRILGDITPEKVRILQEADDIYIKGLREWGLYDQIWQAGAILLSTVRSVGVMGDERTYENPIALRAVTSSDAMTADWAHLPYDFLAKVSNEIINKVRGVNRVCYDISSKPPATIEWE